MLSHTICLGSASGRFGINGWSQTALSTVSVTRATANPVLTLADSSCTHYLSSKGIQKPAERPDRNERDLSERQIDFDGLPTFCPPDNDTTPFPPHLQSHQVLL